MPAIAMPGHGDPGGGNLKKTRIRLKPYTGFDHLSVKIHTWPSTRLKLGLKITPFSVYTENLDQGCTGSATAAFGASFDLPNSSQRCLPDEDLE